MCKRHPNSDVHLNGRCAVCVREAVKKWRKENPGRRKSYGRGDPVASILNNAKCRAKDKGLEFTLTAADIHIPEFCPVLGIRLEPGKGVASPNSPSIDRINPHAGYVPGNVAIISYKANTIKSNATLAEVQAVAAYMKRAGVQACALLPGPA